MATRATYEIDGMNFYCHWDGYPQGAAERFANMVGEMKRPDADQFDGTADTRGGAAFAFIRGNDDAEPTAHRESHGDTEYHYSVWSGKTDGTPQGRLMIHWQERAPGGEWTGKGIGRLVDFCNSHGSPASALVEAVEETPYGPRRAHTAKLGDADQISSILSGKANLYGEDNPNGKTAADRADMWRQAVTAHLGEDRPMRPVRISTAYFGRLVTHEYPDAELWAKAARLDVTGYNDKPHQRAQLQGAPLIAGMCGPMWDGDRIRYEDAEAYKQLSA